MSFDMSTFKRYGEHRSDVSSDRHAGMIRAHLRQIMLDISNDVPLLLEVVGQGPHNFGANLRKAFRPYPISDGIIKAVFNFLSQRVIATLGDPEKALSDAMIEDEARKIAAESLDGLEVPTPPTPEEIARSWKLEDFSSEEHLREEHDRDGRHPVAQFERLVEQMADEARALGSSVEGGQT